MLHLLLLLLLSDSLFRAPLGAAAEVTKTPRMGQNTTRRTVRQPLGVTSKCMWCLVDQCLRGMGLEQNQTPEATIGSACRVAELYRTELVASYALFMYIVNSSLHV